MLQKQNRIIVKILIACIILIEANTFFRVQFLYDLKRENHAKKTNDIASTDSIFERYCNEHKEPREESIRRRLLIYNVAELKRLGFPRTSEHPYNASFSKYSKENKQTHDRIMNNTQNNKISVSNCGGTFVFGDIIRYNARFWEMAFNVVLLDQGNEKKQNSDRIEYITRHRDWNANLRSKTCSGCNAHTRYYMNRSTLLLSLAAAQQEEEKIELARIMLLQKPVINTTNHQNSNNKVENKPRQYTKIKIRSLIHPNDAHPLQDVRFIPIKNNTSNDNEAKCIFNYSAYFDSSLRKLSVGVYCSLNGSHVYKGLLLKEKKNEYLGGKNYLPLWIDWSSFQFYFMDAQIGALFMANVSSIVLRDRSVENADVIAIRVKNVSGCADYFSPELTSGSSQIFNIAPEKKLSLGFFHMRKTLRKSTTTAWQMLYWNIPVLIRTDENQLPEECIAMGSDLFYFPPALLPVAFNGPFVYHSGSVLLATKNEPNQLKVYFLLTGGGSDLFPVGIIQEIIIPQTFF